MFNSGLLAGLKLRFGEKKTDLLAQGSCHRIHSLIPFCLAWSRCRFPQPKPENSHSQPFPRQAHSPTTAIPPSLPLPFPQPFSNSVRGATVLYFWELTLTPFLFLRGSGGPGGVAVLSFVLLLEFRGGPVVLPIVLSLSPI